MIENYIKNFIMNKKHSSLDELEEFIINKKKIDKKIYLTSKTNLFKINSKTVFIKEALMKYKKDFLNEFEDFLETKTASKTVKKNILEHFEASIPDILFAEWIEINLDKKIIIFELLFSLLMKPKKNRDKLKIFLNELSDLYALTAIYSLLFIKNNYDDYQRPVKFLKKIEKLEDILKDFLFAIITKPETVKNNFLFYESNFLNIKDKLENFFIKTSKAAEHYSPTLTKRVITNSFKNFDFLKLLSRFEAPSFYEWLNTLAEEEELPHNNLFKDLGL